MDILPGDRSKSQDLSTHLNGAAFESRDLDGSGHFDRGEKMSLDAKSRKLLEQLLSAGEDRASAGPRLLGDAHRLWSSVRRSLESHLISTPDDTPLQVCCLALQLPMKRLNTAPVGKYGQINLLARAEQAAEEILSEVGDKLPEPLLERTADLLAELPQRKPGSDEAKLLADTVNLDDFGVIGLFQQMSVLSAQGQGIDQLVEAAEKRDAYGYFEARLKDGFHFGPLREQARRRLARARQAMELLRQELAECTS